MKLAHDIFSETNPAFVAYAIVHFIGAYLSVTNSGPEIPKVYLALPIALSGELRLTFDKTNKNTGLFEWLERNPQVRIGLSERVNASMDIVTEAIRFGCFTNILTFREDARINLGNQKLKKVAVASLSTESSQVLKRAERLGYWFGSTGSIQAIFNMMELTV
jgi:hypothetical protein